MSAAVHLPDLVRRALESPLTTARRMVAVAALLKAAVVGPTLLALARPDALRFPLEPWLPVLPGELAVPLLVGWAVLAAVFLVGRWARWVGLALTALLACVLVGDEQLYSNHLYLLTTLVALLTLAEGRWVARPGLLLRWQSTIVYGFAAITKINLLYLSGSVMNAHVGRGSLLPFPDDLRTAPVMASLAVASIVVELLLAAGLWSSRWRKATIVLGVGFHLGIVLLIDMPVELTVFALLMFSLYVVHAAPKFP
ncbi:MAG: hypothetical protein ACOC9N_01655 [Gemmatimonadota bacterium]